MIIDCICVIKVRSKKETARRKKRYKRFHDACSVSVDPCMRPVSYNLAGTKAGTHVVDIIRAFASLILLQQLLGGGAEKRNVQ